MKKYLQSFICMLLLAAFAFAGNIPPAVEKAFGEKFPGATGVKWDKENAHEYEASFLWKGQRYSANFNESGEWLETESTVTFHSLPEKIKSAFNDGHKGATVKAAASIENSKNNLSYEVEYKEGVKTHEAFYSSDGTELKKK